MHKMQPMQPGPGDRESLVPVGKVTRPQALKGWFRVATELDEIECLQAGTVLMLESAKGLESVEVEGVRLQKEQVILKLTGVNSADEAENLRGHFLYIKSEDLPALPEDSFYYYELTGCRVYLPDESYLGKVEDIQPGASGDLLVVGKGKAEVLIPAVKDFFRSVDIEEGIIVIDPPEGLI